VAYRKKGIAVKTERWWRNKRWASRWKHKDRGASKEWYRGESIKIVAQQKMGIAVKT
jgi:hypothetical protein